MVSGGSGDGPSCRRTDGGSADIDALYVDGDVARRDAAADSLERASDRVAVRTRRDADRALDAVENERVDCVLAGGLPDAGPLDLLEDVRERRPELPFFVVADGDGDAAVSAADAIAAGATDCIREPAGDETGVVVANRVERAVDQHRAEGPQAGPDRERVVDRVTDAVLRLDSDWRFTLVDERAQELFGEREADLVGRHFWEYFEDARNTEFETVYREVMASREPASVDAYYEGFDEWFHVEAYPEPDGGVSLYFHEITDRKERERDLREYETLVNAVPDGIYVLDEDLEFATVNDGFVDLTGYDRERLLGAHASLVFDDDTVENAENVREELRERDGDAPVDVDVTVTTASGNEVPCEVRGTLVHGPDGEEFRGAGGVLRDVSDRRERERELAQSERRYRALAENFPNGGVFLFDTDRRFQLVAGAGFDPIETSPDDLQGSHVTDVEPWGDETTAFHETVLDRTLDGESVAREIEYEGRVYELRSAPIRDDDGAVTAGLYITQDVTERRERRRKLESQNERLDRFASIVSHDLRAPLNVAKGRVDLARSETEDDAVTTHLSAASDAHDRMNDLIEDLLAVAREGEDALTTRTVEADAIARGAWESIDPDDASLDADAGTVAADPTRLQQLFENLFRNAVEHGGGDVSIAVGDLADGFYVADDGVGMPDVPDERALSEGFSTSEDGTGLGLAIVERVADAHGWTVTVTESDAGGARFEFRTD